MAFYGECIKSVYPFAPIESFRSLEQLFKGGCTKGTDFYQHTLCIVEEYITICNTLDRCAERYSSVYCFDTLLSESIYFFSEQMFKTEKACSDKFKFHFDSKCN